MKKAAQPAAEAPDAAYFVVDGRRWRATDPAIPDAYRQELVNELMTARRAVRDADAAGQLRRCRARVGDAKVALGERGHPWWLPPDPAARQHRIEATTRALLRSRQPAGTIVASDVARIADGRRWRTLLPLVRTCLTTMRQRGEIEMLSRGQVVSSPPLRQRLRYRLVDVTPGPGDGGRRRA